MSTQLNHSEGNSALHQLSHVDGLTVGIVCAEWNNQITDALLQGALDVFSKEGYEDITIAHVPGTVELTYGAAQMARTGRYDAVIMIGCVIRGGTPHFGVRQSPKMLYVRMRSGSDLAAAASSA